MGANPHDATLIVSASEKDSNLYYATKFLAPDPFIYAEIRGKKYLLMSDLEIDRAKAQAKVDEVLSVTKMAAGLKKDGVGATAVNLIDQLFKEHGVKTVLVPASFGVGLADGLRQKGYPLTTKGEPFYEERVFKTDEEIEKITQTLRHTEAALKEAIDTIASSTVKEGKLYINGELLTSERIKKIINVKLMEYNCIAEHTIVSCGKDCVDPHNQGSGPLLANESIILDVFPRSADSRYFADITRTVVKGKASPRLKKMYELVKEGQEIAFQDLKDGVDSRDVHNRIMQYFEKEDFKTGEVEGRMQGFFHGTGHGVGLDIHEPPRVSSVSEVIKERVVVTVEPGLYYLDGGGVRLEDMVVVTKSGNKNLTRFPKVLEV